MSDLADRIETLMRTRPGDAFLAEEVANAVKARRATVYDTLKRDERFGSRERAAFVRDRARVYYLDTNVPEQQGTPVPGNRRASQCARLLSILRDGAWHTSKELHGQVPCTLHSRISELRKRGARLGTFTIEHDGVGFGPEFHRYRYVSLLEQSSAVACATLVRSRTVGADGHPPVDEAPPLRGTADDCSSYDRWAA